jgi:hypothetical protein
VGRVDVVGNYFAGYRRSLRVSAHPPKGYVQKSAELPVEKDQAFEKPVMVPVAAADLALFGV